MSIRILTGDCRDQLAALDEKSIQTCVTSPPYFNLRDYQSANQIGLEASPEDYVEALVDVFRGVRRALRDDGTLWLNLGDSYASIAGGYSENGSRGTSAQIGAGTQAATVKATRRKPPTGLKPKDLIGIPWRVAFALQEDGWWLRSAIIWAKPNGMPGSQDDRCTSSYEMVFLLAKSANYFSDFDAIKTPPRESSLVRTAQDVQAQAGSHRANGGAKTNGTMKAVGVLTGSPHGRHSLGDNVPAKDRRSDKQRGHSRQHAGFNDRWDAMDKGEQQAKPAMMRDVWFISPASYAEAHFAVMPDELARRCISAGSWIGDTVLDPFFGAGTTGLVADRLQRHCIGIDLNPEYVAMAEQRIRADAKLFSEIAA